MRRKRVVLPAPLGPTSPTRSPLPTCFGTPDLLKCTVMATFVQYRRAHEDALTQLQAEYTRLTPQEKSRRVLGRDNPLLYSSQEVADKMGGPGLSRQAVERGL